MISSALLVRVHAITKTTSATPVVIFSSIFEKILGLMFKKPDHRVYVFVFDHDVRHVFHTFFCRKLNFWFLNKEGKVVFEKKGVGPCRFIKSPRPYRYVVEQFVKD